MMNYLEITKEQLELCDIDYELTEEGGVSTLEIADHNTFYAGFIVSLDFDEEGNLIEMYAGE